MLHRIYIACLFSLLSLTFLTALAATQDGMLGSISTGQVDIALQIGSAASIYGLQDISMDHIDPINDTLPPSVTLPNVCLYSSTSTAAVSASVTGPYSQAVDLKNKVGKLRSESGAQLDFRIQLNQQDLFTDVEPLFNSSFNSMTCEDGIGLYPLTIMLTSTPRQAGNYKAIVNILVMPK